MKRISTILLFLLLATTLNAQKLVSTDLLTRNAVIEEYTGIRCPNCPDGHRIANEILAANPDKVFVVNIHAGGYAQSSDYNFTTEDGNTLYSGTSVNGFPSAHVNRTTETTISRSVWKANVEGQISEVAECNVAGQVVIDKQSRKATVTVEVYYTLPSKESTNYLNVVMLQDNILAIQDGDAYNPSQIVGGQYRHMHAFRDAITPTWGEEIAPTTAGTFITKTYEYDIPAKIGSFDVNIDDIEFVAFVTEKTRPILNANQLYTVIKTTEEIHPEILSTNVSTKFSCLNNRTINVAVCNSGIKDITSLKFEVLVDNVNTVNETWEGTITSYQTSNIEIDVEIPVGTHDVKVSIVEANGLKYEDTENLTIKVDKWNEFKTNAEDPEMTIELMQDKYGDQITWELLASDYSVLASGGPYEKLKDSDTKLHEIKVKIPANECVKFIIRDTKSNGICCLYGDGYYRILNSKGKVIVNGAGNFGSMASHIISVVEGEEEEPTSLPAPTNVLAMTLNDTELVLMWDAVEGAASYNVYNEDKLVGTYEEVNTKITGLTPGTEYCFVVTAVDKIGESEKSEKACAKTSGEKPEEGVEELQSSILLYPNPVNDKLYIETEIEVKNVVVYDVFGRQQDLSAVSCQPSVIDVSNLNSGVYFVKIVTENGEAVRRFVKK